MALLLARPSVPLLGFHAAGDSLMTTYGHSGNSTTADYLSAASRLNTAIYANTAVSGQTITQQATTASANIDSRLAALTNYTKYLVFQCGINDIYAMDSAETVKTRMDAFISARLSAGWAHVWIMTLTKADTDAAPEGTQRAAYNAALLASTPAGTTVIDLAGQAEFADTTNHTYFYTDHVHYTDAGAVVVADLLSASIKSYR